MARIRSLKPNFTKHEELSQLDAETHLLAAGLLCYADDEGYFNANPKLVQAEIFPLRALPRTIEAMLDDLERLNYIERSPGTDGKLYGRVTKFLTHQRINRPQASTIKALWKAHGVITERSVNVHGAISDGMEGNGREEEWKGSAPEIPKPPVTFNASEMAHVVCRRMDFLSTSNANLMRDCIENAMLKRDLSAEDAGFFIEGQWVKYKARSPGVKLRWFLSDGTFMQDEKDWGNGAKGSDVTNAEVKQERGKAAVSRVFARLREAGAVDAGDAELLPEQPAH